MGKLIEYAEASGVQAKDIAHKLNMSMDDIKKIFDSDDIPIEQETEYRKIIDQVAKDKILLSKPDTARKKNKCSNSRKVYAQYRKYNADIIDYMLAHGATLGAIKEIVKYDFSQIMKTQPLTKDQTKIVLEAIDSFQEKKEKVDVWGRQIIANSDIRSLTRKEPFVNMNEIARALHITPEAYRKMMQEELTDSKKEEIKGIIQEIRAQKKKHQAERGVPIHD